MPQLTRREAAVVAVLGAVIAVIVASADSLSLVAGVLLVCVAVPGFVVGYHRIRPAVWRHVLVRVVARRGIRRMEIWLADQRLERGDRS